MSAEDLDNYETDAELALYKEYRDVIKLFTYVVETERRFLSGEQGRFQRAFRRSGRVFRRAAHRRMGVGCVPVVAFRQERAHRHVQGRECRGSAETDIDTPDDMKLRR